MEWDTAAAHAIVNESGGLFNKYINKDAYQKHVYNKKKLLNDWFVVKSG
jgi:3'-phosphoadenosine 5'-phosphosulfate (PAPS) 3'-phosphatase